ncbi:hypothetical protein BRN02_19540 [Xanthomonas oryzae pv. oryzae]|nr:hypothetical protein BRM96_24165 [Xanthomonas oryzae pv. oryzae]RBC93842.1 hypothetical protein BRN02_19540 [Xanthomonas oryzae pv. oryzae]RBD07171.1 hypothetical protein BRM70_00120 [Xanthomonas oryzae pv. oryzae]RBF25616.1 hypothetical protein BRM92_15975 [Xanthomonas oryzae pv. oryzae]RBK78537.1 hypothetical protein BRN48_15640 [Xanthomonas oryzae pv. oryzae]
MLLLVVAFDDMVVEVLVHRDLDSWQWWMSAVTFATWHMMQMPCWAARRNCFNPGLRWRGLHQPKRPVM